MAHVIRRKFITLLGGAAAATSTIPIVFTTASNPVTTGLVASLNRPGGNATGVTVLAAELGPKRLELLHELLPSAKRIALLVNPNVSVVMGGDIHDTQTAARSLGLEMIVVRASSETEIEEAFATAAQVRASALQVGDDAFLDGRREKIAALGLRHALPTMSLTREAAAAGSLMSYGSNLLDVYRHAGIYVGRILRGEKPADLPVQQPTKFELVVNLKTAKALDLKVPPSLLARADEVIE